MAKQKKLSEFQERTLARIDLLGDDHLRGVLRDIVMGEESAPEPEPEPKAKQ